MVRYTLDSVNQFARGGYNLRITCRGCGHQVEASAVALMQDLHRRRQSLAIAALEPRMRCRACGHRGAAIGACERTI